MKIRSILGSLLLMLILNLNVQGQKVLERGLAEVISKSKSTNKYLVMHISHPRGTLLRIKNPANGKYVDATVIGNMRPKYKLILKVSQAVYEDLHVKGKKFAVEILHAPIYERKKPRRKKIVSYEPATPVVKPIKPNSLNSKIARTQTLFHTVKQGETLYRISRKYKVSVEDIKHWNNLPDNSLKVGQDLVITVHK